MGAALSYIINSYPARVIKTHLLFDLLPWVIIAQIYGRSLSYPNGLLYRLKGEISSLKSRFPDPEKGRRLYLVLEFIMDSSFYMGLRILFVLVVKNKMSDKNVVNFVTYESILSYVSMAHKKIWESLDLNHFGDKKEEIAPIKVGKYRLPEFIEKSGITLIQKFPALVFFFSRWYLFSSLSKSRSNFSKSFLYTKCFPLVELVSIILKQEVANRLWHWSSSDPQ